MKARAALAEADAKSAEAVQAHEAACKAWAAIEAAEQAAAEAKAKKEEEEERADREAQEELGDPLPLQPRARSPTPMLSA